MTRTASARSLDTPAKTNWRDTAACQGKNNDRWFPQPSNLTDVDNAKALCFDCPVLFQCAQYALTTRQDTGIWGGLSERQRTTIRKKYTPGQLEDLDTVHAAVRGALNDELNPQRTLRNIWNQRTHELPGGHIGWHGNVSVTYRGRVYTSKQLAFTLNRGREPRGIVRRTCPVVECVHPAHLADNRDRHRH